MGLFNLLKKKDDYVNFETQYLKLLQELYERSCDRPVRSDRTKVGCHSLFGRSFFVDLRKEFPMLTTKKVWWGFVVEELLWFLSGSTNVNNLPYNMRHLWKPWCTDEDGDLGPIYGAQFRCIPTYEQVIQRDAGNDQILELVSGLIDDPHSRRHVMSTWNYSDLNRMGLSPCHGTVIQFFIEDSWLDLSTYQRSQDVFLGGPFNIPSYSLLMYIIGGIIGKTPRYLNYHLGDAHLYHNHRHAALEQLERSPMSGPQLQISKRPTFEDLALHSPNNRTIKADQFIIRNYTSHPAIKAPLAI
jgi:thymidylate synthase